MEERWQILALREKGSGTVVADQRGVRPAVQGQPGQMGAGKVIGLPGDIHQEAFSVNRPARRRKERKRHLVRKGNHTGRNVHLPDAQ